MATAGKDSLHLSNIGDQMETTYPLLNQLEYYTRIQKTKANILNCQFQQAFSE
jgi:hypothetical protein